MAADDSGASGPVVPFLVGSDDKDVCGQSCNRSTYCFKSNCYCKHNHTAEETQRIKNLHMSGNLGSSDCKTLPIKRSMLLLL